MGGKRQTAEGEEAQCCAEGVGGQGEGGQVFARDVWGWGISRLVS